MTPVRITLLQDHLGSTSGTADDAGNMVSTISYYPFGGTWATTGTLPTDKKFTGQRLDNTGLYYYGARYYDPEIGRFISADTIVPDPMNPQSLNRYSYCLNNPLRYIDPSGLTYQEYMRIYGGQVGGDTETGGVIVVGGSSQPRSELQELVRGWYKSGILSQNDFVTILEDNWPEFGFDVTERLEQLYAELALGYKDVKLFGFSEGAATIGTLLWQLANDPGGTANKMGATPIDAITAAVMFECTNGVSARTYGNHGSRQSFPDLTRLPAALAQHNISLADVWNTNSVVHGQPIIGWEGVSYPYSSTPGLRSNTFFGFISKIAMGTFDANRQHGNILNNQYALNVMHDTFYPE